MPLPEIWFWWNDASDLPSGDAWDWTADLGLTGSKRPPNPSVVRCLRMIQPEARSWWESTDPAYAFSSSKGNYGRWLPRLQTRPSYIIDEAIPWGPTGDVPNSYGVPGSTNGRVGLVTPGERYLGDWSASGAPWPSIFANMTQPPPKLWPNGFSFDEDDDEHIRQAMLGGRGAANLMVDQAIALYGDNPSDWVLLIKGLADDDYEGLTDARWRGYWKWAAHAFAERLAERLAGRAVRAMQFHIEARRDTPAEPVGYDSAGGFPAGPGQFSDSATWSRVRRDWWIRRLVVDRLRQEGIRSQFPWGGYGTNQFPDVGWWAKGSTSYAAPSEAIPVLQSWLRPGLPSIPWISCAGYTLPATGFTSTTNSVRDIYGAAIDGGCEAVVVWLDQGNENATDVGNTFEGIRLALELRGYTP